MNEKPDNYNLLEEPWIPVLWSDGQAGRVGIREAFTQASRIRQIAASNPMDRVAIVRFLLAVLYWCKGNPPEEKSALSGGAFPEVWFSRLDENEECFNLLGDGKRFYQYRKPGVADEKRLSANYLAQEVPTGTNLWHFRHSTDQVDGLCPACCAMGLLRLPMFATSGGRGKPPGLNSKPPLYVIPVGASLAETLRLSWKRAGDRGTPAWEKPDLQLPKSGNVPLLVGLTWMPRRVWLDAPDVSEGHCISCARKERLIRHTVFAPIGSSKTDEGAPGRIWRDPHVIYEETSKGDLASLHARNALDAFDAASDQWGRILRGLLTRQDWNDDTSRSVWVVGFSTVRNDKYLEATEYVIPCPGSGHPAQQSAAMFDRWQKESANLGRKLRPPGEKKGGRRHVEIPPMLGAIRPQVEHRVSVTTGALLAGAPDAWEHAAGEYRPMMAIIVKSLSPGFTSAAVRRRWQISSVAPNMRPPEEANTKPKRKGGKK